MVARLIQSSVRASSRARAATPLMAFIAGDFAEAVAHVWRAPHGDFFALPAARRHAAAIALARLSHRTMADDEIRRMVEFARDPMVAEALAGQHAQGLMRALSRGGEVLWSRKDYEVFLRLLIDAGANEVLRHMDEVRPAAFAPIAALPPALRVAAVVRAMPGEAAARDLALAFSLAVRMRQGEAGARLARRWASGGDTSVVFRRAVEDLTPDAFRSPEMAPRLPAAFERVASRKQLERTALDFRNCLADHAVRIAEGRMAVYVWRDQPDVAIALNWDVAGWRLAEAKLADNLDLEEAHLRRLVAVLQTAGVRTGPSVQALVYRLEDHASGGHRAIEPGGSFIDQLALGDLWS